MRSIARRTGNARNTVEHHLKCEGFPSYAIRPGVPSKLDAYKRFVLERMTAAHPQQLPGTVLLGELRSRGYTGGITILREHLATLRPAIAPEPVVRFETKPGRQMQVDWAVIRRGAGPQPDGLRSVRHRRAAGGVDGLSRGGVRVLRRHAAGGALRQHAHRGDRAGCLWSGPASASAGVPRLRPPHFACFASPATAGVKDKTKRPAVADGALRPGISVRLST